MHTCSLTARAVLVVFILCGAESLLSAKPKDDIEFALGLAKRRYFDMAEHVCEQVRKNPAATESDKAELQMVSGNILRLQADAENNPEKREQLLERAIRQFETFINGAAGSDERKTEARFTVGELLTQRGRVLGEKYRQETDPAAKANAREMADSRFKKAEEYFQKMIDFYLELADKKGVAIDDDINLMEARRLLPTCKYYHALLYERGSAEHKKLLSSDPAAMPKGAVALFLEFIESYEGMLSAYDSGIVLGLCYLELRNFEDADIWFNYATNLRDGLKDAENISEQMKKAGWDIVYRGYYMKANGFREMGKFETVVNSVQDMRDSCPDALKYLFGKAALLEAAKAYVSLRQYEKAREVAEEILQNEPGPLINDVTRVIDEVARSGVGVSAKGLKQTMDKSYGEKRWQETVRRARTLLNALKKGDTDYSTYAPEAYMAMGKSYFSQGRPLEAATAFARVYEDFPSHDQAPEAAFRAVVALNDIAATTKHPEDKKMYRTMLDLLDTKYPGKPQQKNVPYLKGREFEAEGKYLEAADNYARVEKEASMYEEAFARIGYCYYRHATKLYDDARKEKDETRKNGMVDECKKVFKQADDHFKKYLEHSAKQDVLDQALLEKRNESRFSSIICMGQLYLHELVNRPQDVLPLFTEEELKRYSADTDKMSRANALIVEAYIGAKKLAEAQSTLESMIAAYPGSRRVIIACRKTAIALDNAAKEVKDKDKNAYVELRKSMAKYYAKWAGDAPAVGEKALSNDVEAVAARLVEVANETGDRSWNEQAVPLIEKLIASSVYPPALDATKKQALLWKLGQICAELGDIVRARDAYEQLIAANSQNALVFLELGEVCLTLSRSSSDEERKKCWERAIFMFKRVLEALHVPPNKYSEPWWRAMCGYVTTLFESGEYREAKEGIEGVEIDRKDLGAEWGYDKKLNELRRKIDAKLPSK